MAARTWGRERCTGKAQRIFRAMNLFYIHVITHLSKSIEGTPQILKPNVNCALSLIIMDQYWYIKCNNVILLM